MDADREADQALVGGDEARPSDALRTFVMAWEGCRLTPYLDIAGFGTIGYGHKLQPTDAHVPITQDEAVALLDTDLLYASDGVSRLIYMPIAQCQHDALTEFGFNVGLGNLAGSTLRKRVNGGYFDQAADEFARWNIAGGEPNPNLTKRRVADRAIFVSGNYSLRP